MSGDDLENAMRYLANRGFYPVMTNTHAKWGFARLGHIPKEGLADTLEHAAHYKLIQLHRELIREGDAAQLIAKQSLAAQEVVEGLIQGVST